MKVDLHTHILPRTWPDLVEKYGYGGWPSLQHGDNGCARIVIEGNSFRDVEANCWDVQRRLQDCDRCGVSLQVLSTVPVMFSYWGKPQHTLDLARFLNDHLAAIVSERPSRFAALGTVPLQQTDLAVGELERCMRQLGLRGVQIGTHVNGLNLDEPALFPFFEAAADMGAAIFVHPWDMLAKDRMPRYFLPWLVGMPAETSLAICSLIFGGVLARLPKLRICFAHGGGAFPMTVGRIDHAFSARPDLCGVHIDQPPRAFLRRFYVDSLVHDAEVLRYLIRLFGADRVALGTDYPFPLGESLPGALIESLTDVDAHSRRQMLAETALDFLGLPTPATSDVG